MKPASSAPTGLPDRLRVACAFHDAYERLAPEFGYETRPESRLLFGDLDERLQRLMLATVNEVVTNPGVVLCWAERASDYTACDRVAGHLGRHSWA